ncbi:MAG: sulfatase-like hydrolase/transferase [bacterium]
MSNSVGVMSYKDTVVRTLQICVLVGFFVGLFEAAVIAGKVLASNPFGFDLIADLVEFISLATVIFMAFMLSVGLLAGNLIYFVFNKLLGLARESMRLWTPRLIWFFAVAFTLGIWINHDSPRSLVSRESLLYDLAVIIVAVVSAEIAARISKEWKLKLGFLKKGGSRSIVLVWSAALVLAFAHNLTSGEFAKSKKPNVVLLIVDTLRADHLSCYGYEKETSPAIDEVAKRGVLFEQTYVQWASSLPSHASMMTSMYPYDHGAFPNGKSLNPKLQTLAKVLKAHGYTNGAFVTNSLVGSHYNFNRGFDTFVDQASFDYTNSTLAMWVHSLNLVRLVDRATFNDIFTSLALSWIEKHQSGPFFLWVQWLYPHAPYKPPHDYLAKFETGYSGKANGSMKQIDLIVNHKLKLSEADKDHYTALYDGEVAFADYQIKRIVDRLKALDLLDNSILVITGDHGENLYEHGMEYGHYGVYDSSLRIPLIFSMPGELPVNMRIPEVVQSIDIAPTILNLLEVPIPKQFQGKSLVPLTNGADSLWQSVAYSVMFRKERNFLALRKNDWKIILDVRKDRKVYELYNIPADPYELNNLIESDPAIAASLKQDLNNWIESDFKKPELVYIPGNFFKQDFDKKTMERLRSLGYIK